MLERIFVDFVDWHDYWLGRAIGRIESLFIDDSEKTRRITEYRQLIEEGNHNDDASFMTGNVEALQNALRRSQRNIAE